MTSKLIGQGSYGCVYYPAVDCKDKKQEISSIINKNKNKYITKFTYEQDEVEIAKVLYKIDPDNEFFIYSLPFVCNEPDIPTAGKNKCNVYKSHKNENFVGLYNKYGGISLQDYFDEKSYTPTDVINIFYQCVMCLYVLHSNGIYHLDLSERNILYNKKEKRVYFIDFGFTQIPSFSDKKTRVNPIDNEEFRGRIYETFPLNYILLGMSDSELRQWISVKTYSNYFTKYLYDNLDTFRKVRDQADKYYIDHPVLFSQKTDIFELGHTFHFSDMPPEYTEIINGMIETDLNKRVNTLELVESLDFIRGYIGKYPVNSLYLSKALNEREKIGKIINVDTTETIYKIFSTKIKTTTRPKKKVLGIVKKVLENKILRKLLCDTKYKFFSLDELTGNALNCLVDLLRSINENKDS